MSNSDDQNKTWLERDPKDSPWANPEYGKGRFRRRIGLRHEGNAIIGELEDHFHGFRCRLSHDGEVVTKVEGDGPRIPLSTCGGAIKPLQALVGTPLSRGAAEINQLINARSQCTHWFDLAILAIGHSLHEEDRIFDMVIEDETDTPAIATVCINGKLIHRWTISMFSLKTPEQFADKPLWKGFAAWAGDAFDGDEEEAAFALQKAYFVAQSRRFDVSRVEGMPVGEDDPMIGNCYSYSDGIYQSATRNLGNRRDFSESDERLLKFV